MHPCRRYPEILRQTDCPIDGRRLYRLFLFCPARPVGEGEQEAEPHGIDFKFARNRRERVAPFGVASLGRFILPRIEALQRVRRERYTFGHYVAAAVSRRNNPGQFAYNLTPRRNDVE